MSKVADKFASVMCTELRRHLKKSLKWKLRGPDGWNVGHQSADLTGYTLKAETPHVLIEIERRRDAPVSNVVKVWAWVIDQQEREKRKFQKTLILIQAFSAHYGKADTRKKLAKHVGTQMEKAKIASYICIPFKYKPKKNAQSCQGACQGHATRLARTVVRRLRDRL